MTARRDQRRFPRIPRLRYLLVWAFVIFCVYAVVHTASMPLNSDTSTGQGGGTRPKTPRSHVAAAERTIEQPGSSGSRQQARVVRTVMGYLSAIRHGDAKTQCDDDSGARLVKAGIVAANRADPYGSCLSLSTTPDSTVFAPAELSNVRASVHGARALFTSQGATNAFDVRLVFESGAWRIDDLKAPKLHLTTLRCSGVAVAATATNTSCSQANRTILHCRNSLRSCWHAPYRGWRCQQTASYPVANGITLNDYRCLKLDAYKHPTAFLTYTE